jgi:hypothetical protein
MPPMNAGLSSAGPAGAPSPGVQLGSQPGSQSEGPDRPVMVHVASRVTEEVFSFLGPATSALAESGVAQMLVVLDDERTQPWLARFGSGVELRRVAASGAPLGDLLRLRRESLAALQEERGILGLHLHGLIPCLLGASAAAAAGVRAPVFFSPHGSRLLGPLRWVGRGLLWALRRHDAAPARRAIVSHKADLQRLQGLVDSRVRLIESPVLRLFLQSERREAATPLIVGGGEAWADDAAVAMFVQLVVLLRDTSARPQFSWMGPVTAEQAARLRSANVGVVSRDDEAARARLLSQAWIYLAATGGLGVPIGLNEAMASGVACVAADTQAHRETLHPPQGGLLYGTQAEAAAAIAQLLDSPAQRVALGQAARAEAMRRFDDAAFAARLLEAYGDHGWMPAPGQSAPFTAHLPVPAPVPSSVQASVQPLPLPLRRGGR